MSKARERLAFGVFLDGQIIKIAQLALIDGKPVIQRLTQKELSTPLYPKEDLQSVESYEFDEPENFSLDDQIQNDDILLPDFDNLEISDTDDDEFIPPNDSGITDLQIMIQTFIFEKGRVSLNANDEQISYHQFDSSFTTSKLLKKLKSELLTKEELKSKSYSLDYLFNPNNTGLAFVHRGQFELLNAVMEVNTAITKENFHYNHIDTNEICLMNMVRRCYDLPPEDYVTILYIGVDYKVGIVLKGESHIKTFPIIVTETDSEKMRSAIYAKLILEQDVSNLPITQHVLLAGDYVSDDDVSYYEDKGFYWEPLRRLELEGLEVTFDREEAITPEKIAQFAIPISLAWKTLETRNPSFFHTNLLPSKVIESQKYFKIAWHGFFILALLFFVVLYGTVNSLRLQQEIITVKNATRNLNNEIQETQRKINAVNAVKYKMSDVEDKLLKVKEITGFRNQWGKILKEMSTSLRNRNLSWLNVLETSEGSGHGNGIDARFEIMGHSTSQRNIVALSNLFPDCRITQVSSEEIEDIKVWAFTLNFGYPEVKDEVIQLRPEPIVTKPKQIQPNSQNIQANNDSPETETVEYNRIIRKYFAGDTEGSLSSFSVFAQTYPNHAKAYNAKYFVGECNYHLTNYSTAIQIFNEIVVINRSKKPDAYMMLGNCYEKIGDFEKAVTNWQNLVNKFPKNNLTKLALYKIDAYRED
ncbi:MAG: tetratricopeptide repeat protein [Candidatus Heimdallarchaeaceae archaeon]